MNSPKDQPAEFDLPTQLKSLLTNPLVFLAWVSAFSYFVALVFEVFYCKYFGIPYYLVTISKTIWLYVFVLVGLEALFLYFSAYHIHLVLSGQTPLALRVGLAVVYSGMFYFYGYVMTADVIFALIAIPVGFFFASILAPSRYGKLARVVIVVLLVVIGPVCLAGGLGHGRAKLHLSFPVISSQGRGAPKLVVLYSDGEHLICAPFRPPHMVERSFVLLDRSSLSQDKNLLQIQSIGPLHSVPGQCCEQSK